MKLTGDVYKITETMGRVEGSMYRVEGGVSRVEGGMDRVEEGINQVEESVGRVEKGLQKIDSAIDTVARGLEETLVRVKDLQAPNYPYPHLVTVEGIQADKRSTTSRLRGMFQKDLTLHFLCSFDMRKVPCGVGGNGYRLRKTRGWVKSILPALQVRGKLCDTMLT